ncbi:hypothetical protein C8A03DRAFT_39574, partial [Achaetomium macrosporum]
MGDHPASSLPPRWCRWPQPELDRRLAELGLIINAPEPAVICRSCGYALQPNGECVTRHLADKHGIQKELRHGLTPYIHSLRLPDPNTLPLRSDWSPAHPNLAPRAGVACRHCNYRTTSVDLVTRHLAKAHNRRRAQRQKGWLRDEVFQGVVLQSWTQNGARGYWIATQGPSVRERQETASSWLRDQATTEQRAVIDQLHQAERDRLAARSAAAQQTDGTSTPDLALHTNWMRRTGWLRTFDGASRDVLVRLALPPCPEGDGLRLNAPGNQVQIWSPREDEERLSRIASALRGLQGRCEDTAPFEIVGRQTTARAYWRLFLRFLCFSFRLWRLPEGARASLCRRSLTETQHTALRAAWSALGEDPRTRVERGAGYISAAVDESNAAQPGNWSDDDSRDDTDDSGTETGADDTRTSPRFSSSRYIGRSPVADDNCDDDLGGSYDENDATDQVDSDSDYGESEEDAASSTEDESDTASDPYYQDILLRLAGFLVTEPFRGGQASSTLLVYFSGVIGLSADGSTYMRPLQYTPKLSALIYCARLVLLETVLPRFSHDYVRIPARPRRHQVERLNKVRRKAFCIGCQAPVGELLSLRGYGRKLARTDGPVFRFRWSDDGQVLSWDDGRISMQQFRALSHDLLRSVTSSTRRLMYDLEPQCDLHTVRDKMSTVAKGYSFVTEPANRLQDAFLALSERACLSRLDGLIGRNGWDQQAVRRYMALHDQMLADL